MSYNKPRLDDLNMNMMDAIAKMSDGNPGGLTVMADLIKLNPIVDPDDAMGSWGVLFSLDNLDCYGSDIWVLFKDIYGSDHVKVLGVLRAIQLGKISSSVVSTQIQGCQNREAPTLDVDDLLKQVMADLPNFNQVDAQDA